MHTEAAVAIPATLADYADILGITVDVGIILGHLQAVATAKIPGTLADRSFVVTGEVMIISVKTRGGCALSLPEIIFLFRSFVHLGKPFFITCKVIDIANHKGEEGRLGTVEIFLAVAVRHKAVLINKICYVLGVVNRVIEFVGKDKSEVSEIRIPII